MRGDRRSLQGAVIAPSRPGSDRGRKDWLEVVTALRHHSANGLQLALGWAQLGEAELARTALERLVREEALLSALLHSAEPGVQRAFLRLYREAECLGRGLELSGDPASVAAGALSGLVPELRRELRAGGARGIRIHCADGAARLECWEV